jgi:RHS repeat-associated protein
VIAGATTNLAYDGSDLVAEYDSAGTLLRRYVHGPGVDEPLVWYEGSTTTNKSWLYADHLGSIVATANSTGSSTATYSYGPFGEPNVTTGVRFRYTGQQLLGPLGLYYYKARFYSPSLGRFLQTDPIGYADDLNLYAYVGNNPTNRIDPLGLEWQIAIGISGSFGGSPIIIPPGGFVGGGINVGLTSSGQVFAQTQATGSIGGGVFGGVGIQLSISRTTDQTPPGLSVQQSLQGDFNFGAGASIGASVQYDVNGGGAFQTGVGNIGAGYGLQLSAGVTQTVTLASPPLFSSNSSSSTQSAISSPVPISASGFENAPK